MFLIFSYPLKVGEDVLYSHQYIVWRRIAAMTNANFGWVCLLFVVFIPVIDGRLIPITGGVNGGADCATCSIVLGLVDKLSIVYNESIVNTLERLCSFLPGDYKTFCKIAVEYLGKFCMINFR
jgi:hypothetical protein